MKKTLTATMVLGLAASAHAQLRGSDTLFEMINDPLTGILANCPAAVGITYVGTGSSNGETDMRNNVAEIAPMSRFLNAAAANTCRSSASGCYLHSLDALTIFSNANNTDGVPGTGGVCNTINYGKTLPGTSYVVDDWRTALRLVYGGLEPQIVNYDPCSVNPPARTAIASKNCASPARAALVNTWGNLFQNNCNDGDCTQLKHAFRRDDTSGTTDVFLEILAMPAITADPFCNGNEIQDADTIRRACDGNGRTALDGEQVCQKDGTLGLVLPILIPTAAQDPYLTAPTGPAVPLNGPGADCVTSWEAAEVAPLCAGALGGTFQRVANPPGVTTCPLGTFSAGSCIWPKLAGSAPGVGFSCINGKNNVPGSLTGQDGRAWNLFPRRNNGNAVTYQRGTSNRVMQNAYYRLHMTSQLAAGDRPVVTVGTTTRTYGCTFADATEQIGCLVEASPCSIGYAGNSAASPNPECGSAANRRALALETPAGGGAIAFPGDAEVRRFLDPSGPSCAANGDFDLRYPLSRGLWLCTLDGVQPAASAVTPGTQSAAYLTAQYELAQCFQSRQKVDTAAIATGFIPLDATQTLPISFRVCQ